MSTESLIEQAMARIGDAASSQAGCFPVPGLLVALAGWDDGPATEARSACVESCCAELVRQRLAVAVVPVGPGGLLGALVLACQGAPVGVGCTIVLPALRDDNAEPETVEARSAAISHQLLSEQPGRCLLAILPQHQADARLLALDRGVPLWPLGRTGGAELVVRAPLSAATRTFLEVLRSRLADWAAVPRAVGAP